MASGESENKEMDADPKGYCPKSMDGKHEWEMKDSYSICKHCQDTTTKKILFD
jgi:hypothetical protein